MPALIQRHDILLIAGIVAAGADLTLAVTYLHHVHTAVDDGIPVVEILEVAEGGAGVVELADGILALLLAQQGVIGLHARVVGLVVQGAVVAGDDAGGIEGVDMAGAAGPGHLEAADGHHVAGVVLVELGDGVLVGLPAVAGIGILDQGGVIEGGLHIGGILGIEIVGVVGEGHELDVGAGRQASDIAQGAVQRAGAVGILGMAMELAEVVLILCGTHGEEPGDAGALAIGAPDRHRDLGTALGQVGSGGVGDAAAFIGGCHGLAAHGHGDGGSLPGIGQSHGNGGTLILAGLAAPGGGGIGKDGFVLNGDLSGGGDGNVLIVRATDVHGELIARDGGGGDGDGVGAVLALGDGERGAIELGGHVTPHAEGGVHGEGEGIVRAHIGIGQVAQDHGGVIHDAVRDRARPHGVEGEGVDGVVGDIIHGIDLEAVTVILQPLTMALVLGGAALHLVAAYAAGAGADQPVGVLADGLGVEGVVAGAARAEVAVGLVIEAVVVAVFLHLEHHGAVGAGSLAILNGGGGLVDGGAGCIIVLRSQDSLGILIVDDHLVAHGGETAGGLVGAVHRDELQGVDALVGCFVGIGGELRVFGKPLHIVGGAICVDEIEAAVGGGLFHLPGVVDLVEGQTIAVCVHGQLLAIGSGDGVDAVSGTNRPNQVGGGIIHLAIGDSDILTGPVIGAGGIGGHGLAAAGVIDDILAISHQRLIHRDELQGVDALVGCFVGIGGELRVFGKPLHIVGGAICVDEIEAAVGGGLFHLPGVVDLVEGQTIAVCVHGQLLAIGSGDGVDAVFGGDRPNEVLGGVCHLAVGDGDILTGPVIGAGGVGGHGLAAAGVIDDILAVLDEGGGSRLRVGGLGAGFYHQVDLLLKGVTGAGVGAPVAFAREPLETILVGAAGVVNVEGGVLAVHCRDLPVPVDLVQGRAGEVCAHGQFLAIGGGEGVGAVVVNAESPLIGVGKALELAVGQGHIGALVVVAGVLRGQSFPIGGVEYDHLVAIPQGGQVCDDAALTGGGDLQPIDAGQQHAHVGGRGVVQEPGRLDVVQDAAAGRIRAGHSGQSAVVNGDGPCTGSLAGVVQRLGISGIDLLAVGRGERPLAGLAAQREDLHGVCRVSGVGFNTCEQLAGQAARSVGLAVGRRRENDLVAGFQRGGVRYQRCLRRCVCKHRCGQQRQQHHQCQQHG